MARKRGSVEQFPAISGAAPVAGYLAQQDASGNVSWIAPGGIGQAVPACRATNTAGTSISNTTDTVIPWATESYDTDSMHDNVTNNSRITINTPGVYVVTAAVADAFSATGSRLAYFKINGSTICALQNAKASDDTVVNLNAVNLSMTRLFNAGDYIEVFYRQTSGGALALITTSEYNSFTAAYVGGAAGVFSNTPGCRITNTAGTSITNATDTVIPYAGTERFDTDSMHEGVTNPSRITFNTPGIYTVGATVDYATNTTGQRELYIRLNGATVLSTAAANGSESARDGVVNVNMVYQFNAGDYIEFVTRQTSGGALALASGAGRNEAWAVLNRSNTSGLPTFVTSLPTTPFDGQRIDLLLDATNRIIAPFRYNAGGGTYKWESVGDAWMRSEGLGGVAWGTWISTASTTHTDLAASTGPSITVPFAGEWDVEGTAIARFGTSASVSALAGIYIFTTGDTSPSWTNSDGAIALAFNNSNEQGIGVFARKMRTVTAAGNIVKLQYATSNASAPAFFYNRSIRCRPIRVG